MPTQIASEAVTLKGGYIVSLDALQLLWNLETRGLNLEEEGQQLAVSPRSLLTDDDRARIRQHRDELLQLVRYCETVQ
jgi:hypothetical protein